MSFNSGHDEKIDEIKREDSTTKHQSQNLCAKDTSCEQINHFVSAMNQYETNPHGINTSKTLNHFIHLLQEHHYDGHFEHIYRKLSPCVLTQCEIFNRNNRNRACVQQETNNSAARQIMDKMHCYFHHCYDIGHRLSMKEKKILNEMVSKIDPESELPVNIEIIRMNQMLQSKRDKYRETYQNQTLNHRINTKYSQFTFHTEHKQTEPVNNRNVEKQFSFGYIFKYGEDDDMHQYHNNNDLLCIEKPKYGSFQEEITCNKIATLTMQQFKNEYEKAEIHFNSNFCKENYRPFTMKSNHETQNVHIQIHHILSLLIYCNYTNLQYTFSKTYREKNGVEHVNFYHFGLNLKICTGRFGTRIQDGQFSRFFHGIGQKLLFPQYIEQSGVYINCPLSTTSSFCVAINFANNNQGLVIEFSNGNSRKHIASTKYFSVSWLSDFGNESEFLFIQNNDSLKIRNIVDLVKGIEYKLILQALNDLNNALTDKQRATIDESIQSLIVSLLKYKSLKSLSEYGKYICSSYFKDLSWMNIYYPSFKAKYRQIFQVLFHVNFEWINLGTVYSIFPNCRLITVSGINISSKTFDDILFYFNQRNDETLEEIKIIIKESNEISVPEVVRKYATLFHKINVFVYGKHSPIPSDYGQHTVRLRCKDTHTKFVCWLMDNMKDTYYGHETSSFMATLIECELNSKTPISVPDHDKLIFHQYCLKKKTIYIDCKPNSGWLNVFHHAQSDWINIARLNKVFPNIQKLNIMNGSLCSVVMEDILKHLTNSNTQLDEITISNKASKKCKKTIQSALNRYKTQFEFIQFNINQFHGKRIKFDTFTCTFTVKSKSHHSCDLSLIISKMKKS
eukprot:303713_1